MDILLQVLAWFLMIGIISVLVIVHECGHFLVARTFGFQTPVFGIGLPVGPFVVVGHRWGTQFRVHAALLGGYVAIPELGDESQHDKDAYGVELKPFKKFPIWQRALVAFAGVGFNILFAYFIMFMMLVIQGNPKYQVEVNSLIKANPIAMHAGVRAGDRILAIDNQKLDNTTECVKYLEDHKAQPVKLHLLRGDKPVDIDVTTNAEGKIGMQLDMKIIGYEKIDKSLPEIAGMAAEKLWDLTSNMMKALAMIGKGIGAWIASGGKPAPGPDSAVGPSDVHGILAVMKLGSDIAKEQDWNQLSLFTILISMDLAIINLIPWPALDGGHLAFMAVEAIRGRPMGERAQGEIFRWGLISLLVLMVFIMVNDITALVTGKLDLKKVREEQKQAPGKSEPANHSSRTAPATTPGTPATTSGTPATTSGTPATTSGTPETVPGTPATTSGTPTTTSGTPATASGTPATTPGTPSSPTEPSAAFKSSAGAKQATASKSPPSTESGTTAKPNTGDER